MSTSTTAPLRDILLKLCRREDLTRAEAREAFMHIMSGQATDSQIGGLLVGLAAKGTTVEELVGAATVMREKAIPIGCNREDLILDTCGTGGDVRGPFNLSPPPSGPLQARCLAEAGICFAFARYHHPAMRFVGSARTSLGIPTIFNVLG